MSGLAEKLYRSIEDANERRVFKHFHASSIAECPRAHFYKRLGIEPVTTPGAGKMLRWDVGHKMEEAIRPHLQNVFPNLISNQRFTNEELDLTGEFDNYDPDTNQLIEIKSVHPFAIKHLERENKPHLHYRWQQHAYKLLLEAEDMPVDNITFVYLALDGRVMVFETKPDPIIEKDVTSRLKGLRNHWDKKTLPPCICMGVNGKRNKDHELWGPVLQYCDYQDSQDCCHPALLNQVRNKEDK